jgi:hypothetical protein
MFPRRNWDSLASVCAPPPGTRLGGGGGYTRLRVRGWGSPIPTTGEKLSTLPTLWLTLYTVYPKLSCSDF